MVEYIYWLSVCLDQMQEQEGKSHKKPQQDRFCPWGWQIAGNIIHMLPYYSS